MSYNHDQRDGRHSNNPQPSKPNDKDMRLPWAYPLPGTIKSRLEGHDVPTCSHLGLLLHTFLPYQAMAKEEPDRDTDTALFLRTESQNDRRKGKEDKSRAIWLSEVATRFTQQVKNDRSELGDMLKNWHIRWETMVKAYGATEKSEPPTLFERTSTGRVIVGLGGPSPLETDMTLHHVYGLPYLPGSALKGMTCAYATHMNVPLKDMSRIFGETTGSGTVIFFDAIPGENLTLDLDIMNPHYPNYYQGSDPPSDDQSPRPIFFLTVKNSTFHFAVAPRPGALGNEGDAGQAAKWLGDALASEGIGGKTSSGYGVFR